MAAVLLGVSAGAAAGLYWVGAPSLLLFVLCALVKAS